MTTPPDHPSDTPMIHAAIIAIMRAAGPIAKDQFNDGQKYNFRGIDDVYNRLYPLFCEHGVYSTSEVLDAQYTESAKTHRTLLKMRYTYHAEDGSHVSTEVVGEGLDYGGDKSANKAMSAADKYALLQLLKIPVAMVDPDADPPKAPKTSASPTVQPRGSDVSREELLGLHSAWIELWRANNGNEPATNAGFAAFVEDSLNTPELPFDPLDGPSWNRVNYETCLGKVGG